MNEEKRVRKPPYAPWGTYLNFIKELSEDSLPARVDKSLMTTMSGGVQSIMVLALRSTKMIDEHGVPTDHFRKFAASGEDGQKAVIQHVLQDAYPFFFSGELDLETATPGQFDTALRDRGGVQGSTLDKAANFFLSAAEFSNLPLGARIKARKPVFKRTKNSPRKPKDARGELPENESAPSAVQRGSQDYISEKALEYRLVDLMREAADEPEVMQSIVKVITWMQTRDVTSNPTSDIEDVL